MAEDLQDQFQAQADEFQEAQIELGQDALSVARELAEKQVELADRVQTRAEERYREYENYYQPIERKEAGEALTRIPPSYLQGRAVSAIDAQIDPARRQFGREMAQRGIDPSSGRYQRGAADYDLARAAAEAGARGETRLESENRQYGRQLRNVSFGAGIPSEVAQQQASAIGTLGGAASTAMGGYGQAANAYGNIGSLFENRATSALNRSTQIELAQRRADERGDAARSGFFSNTFGAVGGFF